MAKNNLGPYNSIYYPIYYLFWRCSYVTKLIIVLLVATQINQSGLCWVDLNTDFWFETKSPSNPS
jgi:hypothetical protein